MKLIGAAFLLSVLLLITNQGNARPPIPGPVFRAVRAYWPTRSERVAAFNVSYCESRFYTGATNGQYLGLFQMGSYARSRYGHGPSPWTQARAAYRYYVDSGRDWSPWECRP